MTNLIRDIEAINGLTQFEIGIEHEKEHTDTITKAIESVCKALGGQLDNDTKQAIIDQFLQDTVNDHIVKENYPDYYEYLKKMEVEMRSDSGR